MTNSIYHKAAISSLIKSRANQLLKELPIDDKFNYQECILKAKTLSLLASCIIPLYDLKKKYINDNKFNIQNYMDKPLIRRKDDNKESLKNDNYKLQQTNTTTTNYEKMFDSKCTNILYNKNNQITKLHQKIKYKKKFHIIKRTGKFLTKKLNNKHEKVNNKRWNGKFFRKNQIRRRKRHVDTSKLFDAEVNIKKIMDNKKLEEEGQKIGKLPLNLKNLKRIENYKKMAHRIKNYIENVKKNNEETLSTLNSPLFYRPVDDYSLNHNEDIFTILEKLTTNLEDILLKNSKMSLFSPNFFNILPSCTSSNCKEKRKLFSPTLFSFYQNDGFLSLPTILKNIMYNDEEENKWLNFIFDITGASKTLNKAVDLLAPMIDEMEQRIYPAFMEFEKIESQYRKMSEMYDEKQLEEIKSNGYTFLYEDQLRVIYNNSKSEKLNLSIDKIRSMTRHELEERIERDIRKLASIDEDEKNSDYIDKYEEIVKINKQKRPWFRKKRGIKNRRRKKIRQRTTTQRPRRATTEEDPAAEEAEEHEIFNTLQPFAFFNRINEPVILEIQTLSPHAFILELFSPEIIVETNLSPRAFIATILTPNILVARILQPAAFRMEVLSPRILTAWVLSPEFLLLEVLSPHILDPKVLSPEYLKIVVLSPTLVSPRVLSQEGLGVLVLSPNILSPNLYSRESLIVEILSPHFLGGQEQTESGESVEGETNGEHKPGHKEGHGHHSEFHFIHIHTYPFTHLQIPHTIHVDD